MDNNSNKVIKGTFEVINGELSFNCTNTNASFDEVKVALIKLRDECQRQLDNESKCPFNPSNKINLNTK